MALHVKGYMVPAVSKENGLISTDWAQFRHERNLDFVGRYRINFLIFKSTANSITVSAKINGDRKSETGSIKYNRRRANTFLNNRVSSYLQDLYMEFERLIGKSSSTGHMTLTW